MRNGGSLSARARIGWNWKAIAYSRVFEKHRVFLLGCGGSSSALPPEDAATGRSLSRRNGHGAF